MCGIAGLVSLDGQRVPARKPVERMLDAIAHRGPDDTGVHSEAGVAFGHRRLSILDLSANGHQPMRRPDGHLLTYNGEIYNHPELRALLPSGVSYRSGTDTETLLHLLAERGLDGLHEANGMFAFGWWNAKRRAFHLVRDRFGVKPVYYAITDDYLVFCSELRGILASGLVDYEPEPQAIADYLSLRFVPPPLTAARGIFKLPAGGMLTLSSGRIETDSWYRLPVASMFEPEPAHAQERFEALLADAVDVRLRADVPVGVFLSGGLDSSAVTALVARQQPVKSFAVAFEGGGFYDERFYARLVAKRLRTEHHELVLTGAQFRENLPRILSLLDEPITDMAALPLYFISEEARRHVKVILSGEGSDEVLGGYNFNRIFAILKLLDTWQQMVPKGLRDAFRAFSPGRMRDLFTRLNWPADRFPALQGMHITRIFQEDEILRLLDTGAAPASPRRHLDAQYADVAHADPINQILAVYLGYWLGEDLLMKADKMTMAHALELRVPFLDYRLVEFLFSLPGHTKVSGPKTTGTKQMLRRAMRGKLPRPVLTRDKRGFPVPLAEWARSDVAWFEELFADRSGIGNMFHPAGIQDLLERQRRGEHVWQRSWNLACLWLWDREMRAASHGARQAMSEAA